MSSTATQRMTIGDFLLRRLKEAGVRHLFGVPGDYNLELLQQLQDTGALKWVGTCSELNASYAADGYARLNGLGALLVTNGVGALSAINGVGGSYAEHVPVICIAGSIPLRSLDRGQGMHHTMADGTWDHFLDAYAHVTAARARLTPRNAAMEIDRLILTAWREKLPVYMELPSDIAYLEIEVPNSPLALAHAPSDAERLREAHAGRLLAGHARLPPEGRRPVRRQRHGIHAFGPQVSAEMHVRRVGQLGSIGPAAEKQLGAEAAQKLLSQSFVAGPALNVQFMVKDSKKYAATGGWGFAQFNDGKPADEAVHKTCFGCHAPAKDRDFVFTRYSR